MALTNAPLESNVNENWLFEFSADNNNCLEFDGSGDRIDFGNILQSYTEFTIEFWMKADAVNSGVIIQLSAGSGEDAEDNVSFNVNMAFGAELRLFYEYGSGSNESNTTSDFNLTTNTWIHVAVVRDDASGTALFYKNGVLVETETASNDPSDGTSSSANMTIGNNFNTTNGFNGELAHVRVWSDARSAGEIAHYYNRTIDSTASNLVGYWKLDEGTGSTVADSSSNSNSGTITDATWTVDGFDKYIHSFGVATSDTTVDSNYYPGAILNNNINVRDSIDITSGKSTTSNISLKMANILIDGIEFYKRIFNSTNNYLNKEVRVYAQFNGSSSLSDCQRIFTGRLVDIQLDQNEQLLLQVNSHRPWDRINFPQKQEITTKQYIPTVYGDFTPNESSAGTPADCGIKLYPVPVLTANTNNITTLMPRSYGSSSKCHINLWHGNDRFLPAAKGSSSYDVSEETESRGDANILITPSTYYFHGIVHALETEPYAPTSTLFTNAAFAFDNNDSTVSTVTLADPGSTGGLATIAGTSGSQIFEKEYLIKFFFTVKYEFADEIIIFTRVFETSRLLANSNDYIASVDTSIESTSFVNKTITLNGLYMRYPFMITFGDFDAGNGYGDITIKNIKVEISSRPFAGNSGEDQQDFKAINDLKYFYSGGDGLTESWSGSNNAIVHGLDTHRDLLVRFAGLSKIEPTNYSALNTDRANWKIRYWQLKPTSLKEKLDKLAYEFGFCYKVGSNGLLKYIYVIQTSEYNTLRDASDSPILNLTKNDLNNISVSTTGLSEVITQMDINSELHPAESKKYTNNNTLTNSSTRSNFNLGEKEGKQQVNLDMYTGSIPTSANADCNADWYSYYNNIIGDIKVLVQCDVVNPAKGCQLETGDIVTFTDMPVEMFGTDFSTNIYFMIIEIKRSPGKVSITAREVG